MKETRNITSELRAAADSRTIEGYAFLYDTQSDGLPFTEVIARGAADGLLEDPNTDIMLVLNHDGQRGVLARYNNKTGCRTLNLELDDKGLHYSSSLGNINIADELLENIRRGEITTSSFCFSVAEGGDKWERNADDSWVRTITRMSGLYDVSPVYSAAYSATSVNMRGKELAEAELKAAEEAQRKAEEEQRNAEEAQRKAQEMADLEAYFAELVKDLPNFDDNV